MGLVYRKDRIASLAGKLGFLLTLFAAIFTVTPILQKQEKEKTYSK
jgi:hypothetical protein